MILKYLTNSMVLIYAILSLFLITSCKEKETERNIGETEPLTKKINKIVEKQTAERVNKILDDTNKVIPKEDLQFLREQVKKLAKEKPLFAERYAKKNKETFNAVKQQYPDRWENLIRLNFGDEVLNAYKKLNGL